MLDGSTLKKIVSELSEKGMLRGSYQYRLMMNLERHSEKLRTLAPSSNNGIRTQYQRDVRRYSDPAASLKNYISIT